MTTTMALIVMVMVMVMLKVIDVNYTASRDREQKRGQAYVPQVLLRSQAESSVNIVPVYCSVYWLFLT